MKHFLLAALFVFSVTHLSAQTGKFSGQVLDAKTAQPLPFATVYVNNTTMGVTTDTTGRFTLSNVPVGSAEIVFSFIGYLPQQVKTVIRETGNTPMTIRLTPDSQQLSEVSIKASRDKTWEKQLRRFEKVFLGNTANCKILNPWVIDFTDEPDMLTAKATLPIEIDNRQLGYKLYFQLKKFGASSTMFSIVGNIRFTEVEPSGNAEAISWTKNRERAYRGSATHLMKSLLDKNSTRQGFALYTDKVKGKPRSRNFSAELEYNLKPYDTTTLVSPGPGVNEYRLAIRDQLEVHYINEFTTAAFYKDISYPVSWLEVRGGSVLVNQQGIMLNPTDVAISGSMTDARVSGMLPLDYKPGSTIAPPSPISHAVKRLQEKVYLHVDKPYVYPGDELWFSAYMNYRIPGLMDTLSRVLYVDLINADRRTVQQRILPLDKGRTAGSFSFPLDVKPGNYLLRAYTQWMRNYGIEQFYYKPIAVLALNERVDGTSPKPVTDGSLKITLDKPAYTERSLVNLALSLDTMALDELATGSFSVAVVDETRTNPLADPTAIKTDYALGDPKNIPTTFTYAVERGLTLDGLYTDQKGRGKKTTVTLLPENMGQIYQAPTSSTGAFSVPNLAFYDSTKFVVQPTDGKVVVVSRETPGLPANLPTFGLRIVPTDKLHVIVKDSLKVTTLQEISVVAKKKVQNESAYGQADVTIKGEDIETYASVADAIASKLPTFKLVNEDNTWYLIWARASVPTSADLKGVGTDGTLAVPDLHSHEPNLYIDNVQVTSETAGNRLMQLNPSMIDHVEVNGMITSNQGANGSNGLINVYTKRTGNSNRGLSIIKARGFDREVAFSSPNYDDQTPKISPDYRATLYWNPRVTLTKKPLTLSFFTSDQPGAYRVIVEGVTTKGTPIHSETLLTVND